ncbi:unnamed protein product [Urochloa humidicola]
MGRDSSNTGNAEVVPSLPFIPPCLERWHGARDWHAFAGYGRQFQCTETRKAACAAIAKLPASLLRHEKKGWAKKNE